MTDTITNRPLSSYCRMGDHLGCASSSAICQCACHGATIRRARGARTGFGKPGGTVAQRAPVKRRSGPSPGALALLRRCAVADDLVDAFERWWEREQEAGRWVLLDRPCLPVSCDEPVPSPPNRAERRAAARARRRR